MDASERPHIDARREGASGPSQAGKFQKTPKKTHLRQGPLPRDTKNQMIGGAAAILEFAQEMIARILQRLWHSSDSRASAAYHDADGRNGVYGACIAILSSRRDVGVQSVRERLNIEKKIHFFFIFFLPGSGLAPSLNEFRRRRESIVKTE